jgi:hypothetical protein
VDTCSVETVLTVMHQHSDCVWGRNMQVGHQRMHHSSQHSLCYLWMLGGAAGGQACLAAWLLLRCLPCTDFPSGPCRPCPLAPPGRC